MIKQKHGYDPRTAHPESTALFPAADVFRTPAAHVQCCGYGHRRKIHRVFGIGRSQCGQSGCKLNPDTFCYVGVDALGQGILTFTSQNCGAGNIKRIRQMFRIGISAGITLQLILGISCYVFPDTALSVFTNDPEVLYYGKQIMLPICVAWDILSFRWSVRFCVSVC